MVWNSSRSLVDFLSRAFDVQRRDDIQITTRRRGKKFGSRSIHLVADWLREMQNKRGGLCFHEGMILYFFFLHRPRTRETLFLYSVIIVSIIEEKIQIL